MKAGPRDRKITIQSDGGATENAFGERVESWSEYSQEWAQVIYGTGSERREAGLEGADQPATFRVLSSPTTLAVTPGYRIAFDGYFWDITNVSPLDRDGVEYTAIRRAAP